MFDVMSKGIEPTITLRENPDGRWTARNEKHEVSTQGQTREDALENLDAVVAAVEGDGGREPTEQELLELGIEPAANKPGKGDVPDVLSDE